jgi:FLVCR family feline leukemia virus subgroup C receptor-related protein
LFLLGFFVGPVQLANAELAVDVTFLGDETAVKSLQQFGGNLVSAMLVPIAGRAAKLDYQLLSGVPLLASAWADIFLPPPLAIMSGFGKETS